MVSNHIELSRFGNVDSNSIDKMIEPRNTTKSKCYVWKMFTDFCFTRKYTLDANCTITYLASVLKDWAANMRKKDGSEFKETTVKTMWNVTSKLLQEKYHNEYSILIDPFKCIEFKQARAARDATRKKLQSSPSKRKISSTPFSSSEIHKIINLWDENTPEGLQRKFYHIAAIELAWRGGEAVSCLVDFFHIDGSPTNRIEYNPELSKTCQRGSKKCTESKWLIQNSDSNACSVRLFHKLISKRGTNIKINRLFLRPNRFWKHENDKWYDNMAVGKNIINKWTKSSAEAINLDTKRNKITNHSNRATTVSHLAKNGVQEQKLLKITGLSSADSIKPYVEAWRKIAQTYNTSMPSTSRMPEQLAHKYDNLKTNARNYLVEKGRNSSTKNDIVLERVLQIIDNKVSSKTNHLGDDSEFIHIITIDDIKEENTEEMQYVDAPAEESTNAMEDTTSDDEMRNFSVSKPSSSTRKDEGSGGVSEARIKFYEQKTKLLELECREKELNNRHKQLQILLLEKELAEKRESWPLRLGILKEELEEKSCRNALL